MSPHPEGLTRPEGRSEGARTMEMKRGQGVEAAAGPSSSAGAAGTSSASGAPERATLWVVEDSPTQAEMARIVLAPSHEVVLLPDAPSVLSRLEQHEPPDVLVVDWHLPGMDGLELCRRLRSTLDEATLPILIMTGHAQEHEVVEALSSGANDYVTKPYNPAELRVRVQTLARLKRLHASARSTQRDLEEAEQRFRAITESVPQLVWSTGADGHHDYFNARWSEYTGLTLAESEGQGWARALHPDDMDRTLRLWEEAVRSGEPYEVEYRYRRAADGSYRWFLGRALPVKDASGRITRWFGSCTDIEEQKRDQDRERFLAEASQILGSSLDASETLAGVMRLSVSRIATLAVLELLGDDRRLGGHTMVTHADPAAEARVLEMLRGSPPSEEHLLSVVLRTQRAQLVRLTPEVLQSVARDARQAEVLAGLGVRSLMAVPLVARGQALGVLAFLSSERDYASEDLALAEEVGRRSALSLDNARLFEMAQRERARAEEASRAKDEFLAVVSHELRTPLNAILGWMQMLQSGALPPEKRARALDVVERNAKNQLALIEDLLDVSRIVSGKLRLNVQQIDLGRIVESALDAIRPAAEAKSIGIQHEIAPIRSLAGDPDRLLQVISNLLTNAVKFTPSGGRIEVRLGRAADAVELSVTDSGRGIAPEFLPHVFERFRQADGQARALGGLGLGLAIVRNIVELHGGTIAAHSEGEGRGARFEVRLPVRTQQSPSDRPAALSADPRKGADYQYDFQGVRALVVDDEPDARELIASVLEQCGATVLTAASAAEALEVVRTATPDVLISDIGMPAQSGYDLIRRVRALPPEQGGRTPAVALTGYARMEDRTRALVAGFQTHVPKPIDPTELLIVVATALDRMPKA